MHLLVVGSDDEPAYDEHSTGRCLPAVRRIGKKTFDLHSKHLLRCNFSPIEEYIGQRRFVIPSLRDFFLPYLPMSAYIFLAFLLLRG